MLGLWSFVYGVLGLGVSVEAVLGLEVSSGRPGSKFSPGRDRAGMTFIPAGTGTGTGIEMKTRPGPGLASSRPGPGFFQYFSISVKMKQCYMLNKIFQNKLRYVKLKLTVSSSQGRIQGGGATAPNPPSGNLTPCKAIKIMIFI